MTQEEEILLKDLCSRLPYGVKIKLGDYDYQVCGYNPEESMPVKIWFYRDSDLTIKSYIRVYLTDYHPYLRPLSSMTDEERLYFHRNSSKVNILVDVEKIITKPFYGYTIHLFDWLNKNHFDYRNLIGKGLALKAPEGMYK